MAERVDVSVVIAAWNAAEVIGRSVASALRQDGVELEVIVSDDASSDGTEALARRLALGDARVRVVCAPGNGGPSCARNRAMSVARGRWIAVLDADDAFLPGRLARLVAFAEERRADIVLDNLIEADADGHPLNGAPFCPVRAPERWNLRRWALDNRVLVSRCTGFLKPLLRREFLDRRGLSYDVSLRNSEDYALVAEALAGGARVFFMPEPGYLYTRAEGSASHRYRLSELDALVAFARRFAEEAGRHADAETRTALLAHLAALEDARTMTVTMDRLKSGEPRAAAAHLLARLSALPLVARSLGEAASKRIAPAARRRPAIGPGRLSQDRE